MEQDEFESQKTNQTLREALGLKPIYSQPVEPPVDERLIAGFLNGSGLNEKEYALVLENLGKFRNWRDEFVHQTIERYRSFAKPESSPPPPG